MCDCLIIGFNDYNLEKYVELVKGFGERSGAYRDLDLAVIRVEGKTYRALDILSRYYFEGSGRQPRSLHNVDFMWPAITYLGSYLHKRGFSFDYVNLFHLEKEKLKQKLVQENILTVAITTTLYVIPQPILEIVEFIRSYNKTAKIIVGGPFIGNHLLGQDEAGAQRFFKFLGADLYVDSTEGEFALTNILTALKAGRSLEGIANVAYRDGNVFVRGGKSPEANALEQEPVIYSLFPREELGRFVSVRTAKSCPFACSFCGFPQRAGKYKYLPVKLVEEEMNRLRELDCGSTLTFLDDTFNVPKERFKEILRMMIKNDYRFQWNCFLRSDHADEEAIELMSEAGCEGVFLGMESGSDKMLQQMNKTARTKDYAKAIPLLKKGGIFTYASLIIGFPGETLETFRETFDFIERVKPDAFRAQLWYADPLTPVWKRKEELGIKGSGFNWSHHTMDHETACQLIEKIFLSAQNSTWLPQNGFELWSVFYLKRFGMTVEQIKNFLNSFNKVIKEKLLNPAKESVDPWLLESLKANCKFESQREAPEVGTEIHSARAYLEAEEFWIKECGSVESGEEIFPKAYSTGGSWQVKSFAIDEAGLEEIKKQTGADAHAAILGAYGSLLARWKLRRGVIILTDIYKDNILPLVIEEFGSLNEVISQMNSRLSKVTLHAPHALHVLNTQRVLDQKRIQSPVIESAYLVSNVVDCNSGLNCGRNLDFAHKIKDGLKLILNVDAASKEGQARFIYDANCIPSVDIEDLIIGLQSIFHENANRLSAFTARLEKEYEQESGGKKPFLDTGETFNF